MDFGLQAPAVADVFDFVAKAADETVFTAKLLGGVKRERLAFLHSFEHTGGEGPGNGEDLGNGLVAGKLDLEVVGQGERVGRVPVESEQLLVDAVGGSSARGKGQTAALDVI